MEKVLRKHFFEHGKPEANSSEKDRCHFCQLRAFPTHATCPVTVINEMGDGATLDPQFRFIDRSILGDGVEVAEESFRIGCDCTDDEECMYRGCLCLEEMALEEDDGDDDEANDFADDGPRRKRYAYHSHGAKAGLLRSRALQSREPIYECHSGCACSAQCPNRVVARGRTVPLQIFRTENRGWGVRCPVDIKQGQFVDKYVGEVLTNTEADARRAASDVAKRKDVYLFALDKFSDPASPDPWLAAPPREVDGEFMSGPTRFVNHSCEPNMRIFARVGDHSDKHIHDLAFFAVRDIDAGEELTFDYVDGLVEMEGDARDPSNQKAMTKCLCGTKRCRGFLW